MPEPMSGCWLWIGARRLKEYGGLLRSLDGKPTAFLAHRYVYEALVARIPDGFELDHTCVNPCCVNPDHLEIVTHAVNQSRRVSRFTHCPNGHLLQGENARPNARRDRRCNACRQRIYNQAKTHCPRGHPYSPENTVVYSSGGHTRRNCRKCITERSRAVSDLR